MAGAVTVSWQGRHYQVERRERGESGEPGAVWHLAQDGAPLTSFPADPHEDESAVREKAKAWLEGNLSRPPSDIGRQ
jgi:hypothetical protein